MQTFASESSVVPPEERPPWYEQVANGFVAFFCVLLNVFYLIFCAIFFVIQRIADEITATEQMFLLMTNLYAFMCQFFFFTLCDITLLKVEFKYKRGKVVSGLTTLLLYSIFTYFASKIRDTFMHHYESYRFSQSLLIKFLKVLIEFGKAAIVVLCLREQGLQYHFDVLYSSATFAYYLCTERLFVDGIIAGTKFLNLNSLDGLEHLYIPIVLHIISITLTVGILVCLLSQGRYIVYASLSSYFTLYLPMKNLVWNYLNPLIMEQRTFASFKVANEQDLNRWNDICAVCLERMSKARITPCNHFFHPHCLKRCLQTSMQCPLCKNDFTQRN